MNYYWITAGNTDFDRKRMHLQELPYPLIYYSPATAFRHNAPLILPHEHFQVELGVELAVSINKQLFQTNEAEAGQAIAECFCCAGISNYYHLEKIHQPTPRDKGVCEYYSRWWDSANILFKLPPSSAEEMNGLECLVESDNGNKLTFLHLPLHSPDKILSFLSSFTPLFSGTTICLGQGGRIKIAASESSNHRIAIPQLDFKTEVTVILPDAG